MIQCNIHATVKLHDTDLRCTVLIKLPYEITGVAIGRAGTKISDLAPSVVFPNRWDMDSVTGVRMGAGTDVQITAGGLGRTDAVVTGVIMMQDPFGDAGDLRGEYNVDFVVEGTEPGQV
jgi:hypothetical protein